MLWLPLLGEWEQHFRRPWVEDLSFNFYSLIEYMPDYATQIAGVVGMCGSRSSVPQLRLTEQ